MVDGRRMHGGPGLAAAAALLLITGCAVGTADRGLEPLVVGWEQLFKLDWQAVSRNGHVAVEGYLVNDSPYTVRQIQLLVDSLDAGGNVLAQQVSWAGGGVVEPFSRIYFHAPVPRPAPRYRVRVFAYDRVELGPGELRR